MISLGGDEAAKFVATSRLTQVNDRRRRAELTGRRPCTVGVTSAYLAAEKIGQDTILGSPRQKCAVANLRTLSACTSLPDASTDPQTANTFLCRDYRPTDWAEADVIPPDAKADVTPPELNGQGRAQIHRPRHAVQERCP